MVGSEITVVKNAMKFYNAFIAGTREAELEKIAQIVNPKWSKKDKWVYLFARLGLSYTSKNTDKTKRNP